VAVRRRHRPAVELPQAVADAANAVFAGHYCHMPDKSSCCKKEFI
jgi:hypothetical protein